MCRSNPTTKWERLEEELMIDVLGCGDARENVTHTVTLSKLTGTMGLIVVWTEIPLDGHTDNTTKWEPLEEEELGIYCPGSHLLVGLHIYSGFLNPSCPRHLQPQPERAGMGRASWSPSHAIREYHHQIPQIEL